MANTNSAAKFLIEVALKTLLVLAVGAATYALTRSLL
jgi:hypothetical protein